MLMEAPPPAPVILAVSPIIISRTFLFWKLRSTQLPKSFCPPFSVNKSEGIQTSQHTLENKTDCWIAHVKGWVF